MSPDHLNISLEFLIVYILLPIKINVIANIKNPFYKIYKLCNHWLSFKNTYILK